VTLTVVTGVSEGSEIPEAFVLDQNYPNPFNPVSTIRFGLPMLAYASLRVFDVLGREVRTLVNEVMPAGIYAVQLDASNLASGVYFYRLMSNGTVIARRLLVLK
jgi:hypothetical protein